jgi:hypothetical protein
MSECCCKHPGDSTGVGWLLFAMFCLVIAALAFSVAIIAAHLWLLATIVLRLLDRKWWRAGMWGCVLIFLLYVDGTVVMNMYP